MFDFMDDLRKKGRKIETLALFHEDTLFGTDSSNAQQKLAQERGYKVLSNIKYRANSPSMTAEVQQLKAADADVLMPSSYVTDAILLVKTMGELGYKAKAIIAQAGAGFAEKATYDAVGDKLEGVISRASFSLDLAAKRPSVGKVNELSSRPAPARTSTTTPRANSWECWCSRTASTERNRPTGKRSAPRSPRPTFRASAPSCRGSR